VRNLALVQPLVYSISFFWLAVDRSFDAAVFAFFAYQGFMAAIELNNVNFIFNAISSDVRRQVRSFAEGIGDPIAMALAGFLLLVVLGNVSDSTVPFIGLGVSALYTFFALGVRARYRSSLLSSLRRDWLDFSKLPSASLAQVSDDAMSKEIGEVDLPNQVLLLETLAMHNPQLAIVQLLTCIDSSSRQEQKYLSSVLAGLLKTGNADVLREVILWFHKKTRDIDDSIYETLAASGLLLPSSCQGRVIPQLVSGLVSRSPEDNVFALKAIQDMSLGSVQSLEAALRAVGLGGNFRHAWWAASFCAHKSETIRIAAAEAVSLLARKGDGSLAPFLFPMLNGSEMERMKALTGLAKIGDVGMIAGLLEASRSLSPRERRMVAGIVSTIGIHSVPALVSIIRDQTAFSSVRAIAARALAKVSWPQFEQLAPSLINNEMIAAYRAVAWRVVIEKLELDGAAQRIFALCRRTEANDRIFFVLELLALSGRVGDIDLVSSSLQSTNSRQRGNAIESLEQDIPRPVFKKLLPLIDSRNDNERLAAGVRLFKIKIPNGDEAIAEAMESQETLSQAAALHVSAGEGKNRLIELGVHILQTERDADVRLTARILLARTAGGSESSLLTPVEKADLLARSDVFGGLGVGDIMALADLALDGTSCRESFDAYCCIYNLEDPVLTGRDLLWGGNSQSRTDLTSSPPLLALHPESVLQLARIRTAIAVRLLSVAGGAA
jgi:HEAT repeat protein